MEEPRIPDKLGSSPSQMFLRIGVLKRPRPRPATLLKRDSKRDSKTGVFL